jgi:membrane protein YqaA with SNARE-associated domain
VDELRGVFHSIALFMLHRGGLGLLLVGIADSSFLFIRLPLANDLLIIALSADHPARMPYYVGMATLGSTIGCAITALLSRKAEKGVERKLTSHRFKFVESNFRKHASWVLAISSLIPPPFPFTPAVVAAAVSGYPLKKLLSVIAGARLIRFGIEGGLAILFGKKILSLAESPAVEYVVITLIVIAVGASGFSIYKWVKGARPSTHHAHDQATAH